jgi:hypothetical protein
MADIDFNSARKIMILGESGWGKTYLHFSLLNELKNHYTPFVINTDYENLPADVINLKPMYKHNSDIAYLSLIINRIRKQYNNVLISITDLDRYFDSTTSLTKGANGLKDLYGTGRHQNIPVIVESKQPRYIPPKILANSNLYYIGKFNEIEDIKRLRNYASTSDLLSLKKHEFIEYDKWTEKRRKVMVVNGYITYI